MSGKSDQMKGRAKEAAGVLTGNKDLESEGKTDRVTGEAKEKVEHAKGKVDEAAGRARTLWIRSRSAMVSRFVGSR